MARSGEETKRTSTWAWALGKMLLACFLFFAGCGDDESSNSNPDGGPSGDPASANRCGSDTECASAGKFCDPFSGCVECLFDSQCPAGTRCQERSCKPFVPCTSRGDCTGNMETPACDPVMGRCVRCVEDSDCGSNAHCRDEKCEPYVPCVNTRDCPAGRVCDRGLAECVECVSDDDCRSFPAEVCVRNSCALFCGSDNACRAHDKLCDKRTGHCASCIVNADCPEKYHCAENECVVDVCAKDSSTCTTDPSVLLSCTADGAEHAIDVCGFRESCSAAQGKATCEPWICEPGQLVCDVESRYVLRCAESGLLAPIVEDCSEDDMVCDNAACVDVVCEPNEHSCNRDGDLVLCNAIGSRSVLVQQCSDSQNCDAAAGVCRDHVCRPEEKSCQGSVAVECLADGSGFDEDTVDCADSDEVCVQGECVDKLCTAGETRCNDDGDVEICSEDGTQWAALQDCTDTQFCDDEEGTAVCRLDTCTPGQVTCDADNVGRCDDTGRGLEDPVDCTDTGEVCFNGACRPVLCEGTSFCEVNTIYTCHDRGTRKALNSTCPENKYCEVTGSVARCADDKCTAGSAACNGDVLAMCNDNGDGYEPGGTDCSSEGEVCYPPSPACLPKICEPSSTYCKNGDGKNGNVYRCGQYGATDSSYQTCSAGFHCKESGSGTASCVRDVCTENQPACDGSVLRTCNADGSGYAGAGTDCKTQAGNKNCRAGACRDVVCEPDTIYCKGDVSTSCDPTGTLETTRSTCTGSSFCNPDAPSACQPDICSPGTAACAGERTTTCNANGGSYAAGGTNCSASNRVCHIASGTAECANQAVDTFGTQTSTLTGTLFLNAYSVLTNRSLVNIQQSMRIPVGTSVVTWLVYERADASAPYARIYDKAVSREGENTMRLETSGAVDVDLKANHQYLIGYYATSVPAAGVSGISGRYPSFGVALGAYRTTGAAPTTLPAVNLNLPQHHQVLTTAP